MNSFFDGYVNSKTTLKQFVEQYENALASKVSKENQEDFNSYNSMYPCITDYEMEKELQSFYTNAKFKEFQQELKRKLYCEVSQFQSDGSKFDVVEDCKFGEKRRHVTYSVELDEVNLKVACNCKLFEFRGILCRHAISVLIHRKIYHLPLRYVLRRWRKDIKRCHTRVNVSYNTIQIKVEAQRFEKLCNAFHEVADLAAEDESKCESLMGWITGLKGVLCVKNDQMNQDSAPFSSENDLVNSKGANTDLVENQKISSPLVVRGKGRPPSKRIKSTVEKVVTKKQRRKKVNTEEIKPVDNQVAQADDGSHSQYRTPDEIQNTQQQVQPQHQTSLQSQIRPTSLATYSPYLHDKATSYEHLVASTQFQRQDLEASLRAQPTVHGYDGSTARHHTTPFSQNNNVMCNVGSGSPCYLPQYHIRQVNYSQNQLLPNANVNIYPAQSMQNHLHSEWVRIFFSMGYRGDQVLSVIQRLEESGHRVDFNAVLDRLNVSSSGESQRAFS